MHYCLTGKRVFVAGHRGMVGSAVCRRLMREDVELVTVPHAELDLRDTYAVQAWIQNIRPNVVVLAAAKVGGIHANNTYPVDFLKDNLMIQNAIIQSAHQADVERFLFLGSSCIYPKLAPQPIPEDALLTGPLEATNEPYAIAKIAGLKLIEAYRRQYGRDWISAMPTNLYGTGDNYHPDHSHVLPALLLKIHQAKIQKAKQLTVWGTGTPRREFMHADDLADALVFLLQHYHDDKHINVGSGHEVTISELLNKIIEIVGGKFVIKYDENKPDGTPRKLLDSSKITNLGWQPSISLEDGIRKVYRELLQSKHDLFR